MHQLELRDIESAATRFDFKPYRPVSGTVHPADTMWYLAKEPIGYAKHGASALAAIRATLLLAGRSAPSSILDFGCGFGRVGRWLRACYPDAALTGAEVTQNAVDFYSTEFAAEGWKTSTNLTSNVKTGRYDLIWAGSVFTHLPEESAKVLYRQFVSWLNPGGVAVFSVHGRISTRLFRSGSVPKTDRAAADVAIAAFDAGAYGFSSYDDQENYGMSYSPPTWWTSYIVSTQRARLLAYAEGGWCGNQDIVSVQNERLEYIPR
jgi:SAM-dependent methyltransferase